MPLSFKLIVPLSRENIEQKTPAHMKELMYEINPPLCYRMVALFYEYKRGYKHDGFILNIDSNTWVLQLKGFLV